MTVSTLKEAEDCLAHDITDILYAVGIAPTKLPHVLDLRARGADLIIILDHLDAGNTLLARERRWVSGDAS